VGFEMVLVMQYPLFDWFGETLDETLEIGLLA
jgi:hypothetical protein